MLKKILRVVALSVALAWAVAVAPAQAAEAAYQLDPPHSSVGFAVKHLTVSTVRGHFGEFSGTFNVDETDFTKSSFEVRIKTASINTQNDRRDNHLRSPDFLDVATHPEIVFKSKRIEKSGDGYVAIGDLTIRGVTREVPLRFHAAGPLRMGNRSVIGVEATATINRQDFGVSWSRSLDGGGLVVADDVRIDISIELVKVDAPPPAPAK